MSLFECEYVLWIECFAWVWMLDLKLEKLEKDACKSEMLGGVQ